MTIAWQRSARFTRAGSRSKWLFAPLPPVARKTVKRSGRRPRRSSRKSAPVLGRDDLEVRARVHEVAAHRAFSGRIDPLLDGVVLGGRVLEKYMSTVGSIQLRE
jgi:hypothetical protein